MMDQKETSGTEPARVPAIVNLSVAAKPEQQTSPPNTIAVAKLILEYSKVLIWPIFLALVLLIYQPPIKSILKSLANKFEYASSVKIGSLSLEVQARAADLGVPGLGLKIGQLSPDAIEELLHVPIKGDMIFLSQNGNGTFGLPKGPRLDALLDLEKKGLIRPFRSNESIAKFVAYVKSVGKFDQPNPRDEVENENLSVVDADGTVSSKLKSYGYELTDSGHKAVEAITKAVATQLSQQ